MESHKWVMATFDKSTDYTEMYDSSVFSLNFYLVKEKAVLICTSPSRIIRVYSLTMTFIFKIEVYTWHKIPYFKLKEKPITVFLFEITSIIKNGLYNLKKVQ